ncbi:MULTISPECIES: SHOCT domain-containing protein [unclassified Nocardia]|uniref:SHOCT domain-containing protein n=1 Tax=unclassified Nocardia TaxID=2637762 RepID=UPI001CE423E5|nr:MULTISPECIES: SHOCT domain-containing protein [unclassified Nocardia]
MCGWYDDGVSGWGYAGMGIGMVLFWALLIVAFVVAIRYLLRSIANHPHPAAPPTAEHLLAERFARGEIDEQEYTARLATLHANGGTKAER